MSKSMKTIATIVAIVAAGVVNATPAHETLVEVTARPQPAGVLNPEKYANGILLCNAGASFARFGAVLGGTFDALSQTLGSVGCISHLDHKSKDVVATSDKGARFERVAADIKSHLVRIATSDGKVLGYAEYCGYMYPPAQRAAVDAIRGQGSQ